jgi:hypothetical protein
MLDPVWLETFYLPVDYQTTKINIRNYKFSICLIQYETWYLKIQEEHRLRVFKNRALGRILGPTRNEQETGGGDVK